MIHLESADVSVLGSEGVLSNRVALAAAFCHLPYNLLSLQPTKCEQEFDG